MLYYRTCEGTIMTATLKITTIGNSIGVILPKEILTRLRVTKGDSVYVTETPKGIEISAYDDKYARQMEAGERVMRKHRDVLKKLAE
jgi:putative addiction module antidote